eukprot:scaffold2210_cov316-Pinguiococcus_pyrenoidosus.AAC.9
MKQDREFYAAVDYVVAERAHTFVGNSISTFSAFILIDRCVVGKSSLPAEGVNSRPFLSSTPYVRHFIVARHRKGEAGFHYNGGTNVLADAYVVPKESLAVPTLRKPMKWVFTLTGDTGRPPPATVMKTVKVAVLSARRHTDLIPVCVTTLGPDSSAAKWLVRNGVRVLHHTPAWPTTILGKPQKESKSRTGLPPNYDSVVSAFLRIDIPLVGILDEFVLYTDVDVFFAGPVDWVTILGSAEEYRRLEDSIDFARGKLLPQTPEEPQVLPRAFWAARNFPPEAVDHDEQNAGVMLLNMRSMWASHDDFARSVLISQMQEHESLGQAAEHGAYADFYAPKLEHCSLRHGEGCSSSSSSSSSGWSPTFLAEELGWKMQWKRNADARIISADGMSCEEDVVPFREQAKVSESFQEGRSCIRGPASVRI